MSERDEKQSKEETEQEARRESGDPGGGKGRRDEVGRIGGVYPASSMEEAPSDAVIRGQAEWGQGEKGAAGFHDSGQSEPAPLPTEETRHAEKPRLRDKDEQPPPEK
jgi:hypothetical protein